MSRIRPCWLSIGTVLLCAACTAPVREYRCGSPDFRIEADPAAVWRCNREVLARVARGKHFTLREYREAAAFMERLTGVPANSLGSSLGPLPPRNLETRLPEWDAWFVLNGDRLRWDADHRRIVSRPQSEENP